LITDAAGLPLTLITTPANVPDGKMAIPLLDAIPPIQGPSGRPRFRPDVYQGDRAYGWEDNIRATRERGIRSLLARPMDDTHGSGLGKTRHFIEGTHSWFFNHRRIRLCYERSDESFLAFNQLAAILICHRKLVAWNSS
jgi:transposase